MNVIRCIAEVGGLSPSTETDSDALMVDMRRQWDYVDKSTWGDGPWQSEPDKVVWVDEQTNLDCMLRRNPRHGQWCGYVGVPPGHILHGVEYDNDRLEQVIVHGGLTFSGECEDSNDIRALCHSPEPERPADVWWFGFDCLHFRDFGPGIVARERAIAVDPNVSEDVRKVFERPAWFIDQLEYRDVLYVETCTESLAWQLAIISDDRARSG